MGVLNPSGSLSLPSVPFQGYATGRFYPTLPGQISTPSNSSIVADRQYYQPLWCQRSHTFSAISVRQHNASPTGNLRLGVYNSSAGAIGTLLQDIGAVAFPGSTGLRTITASIPLVGGTLYWLSYVADAALSVALLTDGVDALGRLMNDIGAVDANYVLANGLGAAYGAFAYGALPSTATAPTANTAEFIYAALTGG